MNEWIEELVAQVEADGSDNVRFFLQDSGLDGEDLELTITDVKFEDGEIRVKLQ